MSLYCRVALVGRGGRTSRRRRLRGGASPRGWIVARRGRRAYGSRSRRSGEHGVASSPTATRGV